MKMIHWVPGLLVLGLLAFAGCSKSNKTTAESIPATMDLTKFREAFPSPTDDQKANIAKVYQGVRYGLYPDALAALQKLESDPSLSEPQKQAVSTMLAGVKGAMAKSPATPTQ